MRHLTEKQRAFIDRIILKYPDPPRMISKKEYDKLFVHTFANYFLIFISFINYTGIIHAAPTYLNVDKIIKESPFWGIFFLAGTIYLLIYTIHKIYLDVTLAPILINGQRIIGVVSFVKYYSPKECDSENETWKATQNGKASCCVEIQYLNQLIEENDIDIDEEWAKELKLGNAIEFLFNPAKKEIIMHTKFIGGMYPFSKEDNG